MRSVSITILLTGILFLAVSSCATVSKTPLASGEVRLISMDAVGAGVEANAAFAVNIFFEAAGNPMIKRACFYELRQWAYCSDVSDASHFTLARREAFRYAFPVLVPDHTGWNVMLSIFETEKYKGPMWYLPKSSQATKSENGAIWMAAEGL